MNKKVFALVLGIFVLSASICSCNIQTNERMYVTSEITETTTLAETPASTETVPNIETSVYDTTEASFFQNIFQNKTR